MLESIHIKGYRALKDVELRLSPSVPLVLIGENGSGKSSLLDALDLITALAHGRGGEAIYSRGGWDAIAWAGSAAEIELTVRFSSASAFFRGERGQVEYFLKLGRERGGPLVLEEQVRVERDGFPEPFVAMQGGSRNPFAANVRTRANDRLNAPQPSQGLLRNTLIAAVSDEELYPTPVHVKQALQSIAIYPGWSLSVSRAEGSSESLGARLVRQTPRISQNGRDLLNAMHSLATMEPIAWRELLRDVNAAFPWCADITFPPAAGGRGLITMTWRDTRSGATLYLDDMSEGMRVYLATLVALHAPDDPALLAFDEPERNLHPRALQRLMKVAELRAEKTPVFFATHSDRLLDFIEKPAEVLRVCRFNSVDGVKVEELDPELLREWMTDYTLSQARAQRLLDGPPLEAEATS
jgi:predicted ATPase